MTQNQNIDKKIEVQKIRHQIDEIDDDLLDLLLKRRDIALDLARIKTEINDPMNHEERVRKMLDRIEKKANEMGMDGAAVKELWKALIVYMITEQTAKYPLY
jgi:chorismate mutase